MAHSGVSTRNQIKELSLSKSNAQNSNIQPYHHFDINPNIQAEKNI